MKADELTSQHVIQVVRHLFDPDAPASRSSTRRLISPDVAFDFPVLPQTDLGSLKRDAIIEGKPVIKRHSTAAQALSVFHLPATIANHVPGAHWRLDIGTAQNISSSKVGSLWTEPDARVWRVSLVWTLELKSPISLPFGLSDKVLLQHTNTRDVELWFWSEGELERRQRYERQQSAAAGTTGDDHDKAWPPVASTSSPLYTSSSSKRVRLRLVKYSGFAPALPAIIKVLPLYHAMSEVVPILLSWLLAPFYGALLLLGLDRSTRSLDSSKKNYKRQARRRLRQELAHMYQQEQQRQLEQHQHHTEQQPQTNCKGKGKLVPTQDDEQAFEAPLLSSPMSAMSEASSSSFFDSLTTFDTPPTPPSIDLPDLSGSRDHNEDDDSDVLSCLSSLGESSSQPDWPPLSSHESTYHRLMRQTHLRLQEAIETCLSVWFVLKQAQKEVGLAGQVFGQCVRLIVLVWLNVLNVGADKVFTREQREVGQDDERDVSYSSGLWWTASEEGKRRDRLREHARRRVEGQYRESVDEHQTLEAELTYSPSLWRSHEQPQRKSVSFSLQDAFNPYDDDVGPSDLDMVKFNRRPTRSEARVTNDEQDQDSSSSSSSSSASAHQTRVVGKQYSALRSTAAPRYHNDFGLPSQATSSLFGWQRMQAARQAAVEAVKRRPALARTYSKDDGRVLTMSSSSFTSVATRTPQIPEEEEEEEEKQQPATTNVPDLGQRLGPDHGMDHVVKRDECEAQESDQLVRALVGQQESDESSSKPVDSSELTTLHTAQALNMDFGEPAPEHDQQQHDPSLPVSASSTTPSTPASIVVPLLHPKALATAIEYSNTTNVSELYSPTFSMTTQDSPGPTPPFMSPDLNQTFHSQISSSLTLNVGGGEGGGRSTPDTPASVVVGLVRPYDEDEDGEESQGRRAIVVRGEDDDEEVDTVETKHSFNSTAKTTMNDSGTQTEETQFGAGSSPSSGDKKKKSERKKKRLSLTKAVGKVWQAHTRDSSGTSSKSAGSVE
ncbi:hypothetical protein ACM66B_002444 [Microbotryomycetes sp. NB124-2]